MNVAAGPRGRWTRAPGRSCSTPAPTGTASPPSTTCSPACTRRAAAEGRPGNPNRGAAASTGRGAVPGRTSRPSRPSRLCGRQLAIVTEPNAAFCTINREMGLDFQLPQIRRLGAAAAVLALTLGDRCSARPPRRGADGQPGRRSTAAGVSAPSRPGSLTGVAARPRGSGAASASVAKQDHSHAEQQPADPGHIAGSARPSWPDLLNPWHLLAAGESAEHVELRCQPLICSAQRALDFGQNPPVTGRDDHPEHPPGGSLVRRARGVLGHGHQGRSCSSPVARAADPARQGRIGGTGRCGSESLWVATQTGRLKVGYAAVPRRCRPHCGSCAY
jgi:hypothetical protein